MGAFAIELGMRAMVLVAAGSSLINSDRIPVSETGPAGVVSQQRDTVTIEQFSPAFVVQDEGFYKLTFRYQFPSRQVVRIVGIGEVPATGALSFFTSREKLVFTDQKGTLLKEVELTITGASEGTGSKLPSPEDFPSERQNIARARALTLGDCNRVLNTYFGGYYPTIEQVKGEVITVYTTTFQTLPLPDDSGKVGEIALRVSTPAVLAGQVHRLEFTVQAITRERGKRTVEWVTPVSKPTEKAAREFRDKVVAALKKA